MIGTKSSYTPSTALLVTRQRVLQAFRTFFATTDLAFSNSFILRHHSCAFTKRAVCLGDLAKNFQSCKRTPSTCVMYFVSSLAPAQARASLWQTQCTLISLLLICFSRAATPVLSPVITLAPLLTGLIIFWTSGHTQIWGYLIAKFTRP